jgi:excisionase family DNA binding protein
MRLKHFTQKPDVATGGPKLATDFIDTVELCRRLGCSRRTTTNLRLRGKLPTIKLGKLVRYHWPTVEAALIRRQTGQP